MGTNCYGEERYYFKSDTSDPEKADDLTSDDVELLEKIFGEDQVDEMTDEEMLENYQSIDWTACIRVRIAPVLREEDLR